MTHYAYRITRRIDNISYMGIRTCVGNPLLDLGIHYFTHSTDVDFKKSFKLNPLEFKLKILKIFSTRLETTSFEVKYHQRLLVGQNPRFANKCQQTSAWFDVTGTVVVRKKDSKGKYFRIPRTSYEEDKTIWETPSSFLVGPLNGNFGNTVSQFNKDSMCEKNKDKVVVKNQDTNKISKVDKQEFDNSHNLVGIAAGTVTAKNLDTDEYSRVSSEEFAEDDNLVGVTFGGTQSSPK